MADRKRMEFSHHISRQFDQELEAVRANVLKMGGLVEQQLDQAMTALTKGDSELGESVARDDFKVNSLEVEIDEECSRILAKRSPTAGDLRFVVTVIKTITDLERIGDEAEKIGYLAAGLAMSRQPKNRYREVRNLGVHVKQMVHESLNAFARLDPDEAFKVAKRDVEVDEHYESILRQLITFMMEDPRTIRPLLSVMWVARALERIGDHAKNICEYVIYLAHGKDVRHIGMQSHATLAEVERKLDEADS